MESESGHVFAEALGADVVLPVTGATVYALRQEIVRLEHRLGVADALCQAWEDEMAFNDGADVERPDVEEARAAWLASR